MIVTQNSCEVNREPAHISVASSEFDFDQTELSCNILFDLNCLTFWFRKRSTKKFLFTYLTTQYPDEPAHGYESISRGVVQSDKKAIFGRQRGSIFDQKRHL